MHVRAHQIGICLVAGLLAALFVHWVITQPVPLVPVRHELNLWPDLLFRRDAAARYLAWFLVTSSFATSHLFFVTPHAEYRALLGWDPLSPLRLPFDAIAYAAALMAPLWLARFFLRYPRVLTPEDWEAESLHKLHAARESVQAEGNWRRWLYPAWFRRYVVNGSQEGSLVDARLARSSTRLIRLIDTPILAWLLLAWAVLCACLDFWGAQTPASVKSSVFLYVRMQATMLWFLMLALTWEIASRSLRLYARGASPQDRRRIDWITSSVVIGGVLVVSFQFGGLLLMLPISAWLMSQGIFLPKQILLAPTVLATQVALLVFVLALAASIFYRGAIDPKLAARRITVFGVLGTLFACVFVLVERTVAIKLVAYFGLSPDTGGLIAFAMVAATAAPIRLKAVAAINTLASRYLPLDSMIEGERRTLAVALSDLSGYTLLSSSDEKQAMLLAALLQRQAARVAGLHGGRVVKSMGDAVLFAFEDAAGASAALVELHRGFEAAAEQFGLLALPVHSGAHLGEVTVAQDGDLYGQTVNIAARIQGSAQPGQIVVSAAFADAAGGCSFLDLGERPFKNVPEAIACRELRP